MLLSELHDMVSAVCPLQMFRADGTFDAAPGATSTQIQQGQAITAANIAKVNGQSSRTPNDIVAIFNYIKPGGTGNLTAGQQAAVNALCSAVVLAQFPALAARINQQTGLAIPYDQANPNG
jgi:hypothetical protein